MKIATVRKIRLLKQKQKRSNNRRLLQILIQIQNKITAKQRMKHHMPKVKFLENLSLRVIVKAQIKEKILSNNTLLLQRIILGKIKIKKNLIVQRAINLMENLVRNKMGKNKIIRKKLFQKLNQMKNIKDQKRIEVKHKRK